jgi:hypothetical protein
MKQSNISSHFHSKKHNDHKLFAFDDVDTHSLIQSKVKQPLDATKNSKAAKAVSKTMNLKASPSASSLLKLDHGL